jgi:hypothetical protein
VSELLRDPPLDPAGGDDDDLLRERIVERLRQQLGEPDDERVESLGAMDVEGHESDPKAAW